MIKQLVILFLLLTACSSAVNKAKQETAKQEIFQTERAFEAMAKERGLSESFAFFADSAASLNRGSYVIHGKDSIRLFYLAERYHGVKLEWKPDFVEVSSSADLGYTYGKYLYSTLDSTGKEVRSSGIFHTVWKKQANGQWRFVWD
jgi:ketosteroid isomerase-like protein